MYEISGYRAVVGGGGAGEWCDRPGQQCEITGYSGVVGGGGRASGAIALGSSVQGTEKLKL